MTFFGRLKNIRYYTTMIFRTILLLSILLITSISLTGCGKFGGFMKDLFRPELKVPVFDPNATITPQSGAVIYEKNGIVAIAVPLNDVKNIDAFAIILYNKTNHWISYKKEDCKMLDQSGNITKQIDKSQESFYVKKKPKLPPEFNADVFRYDKAIRIQGDHAVLPTEDFKKTTIMPKHRSDFMVYFPKRSSKSNDLRIIVPGVTSEFNNQQSTFVFKFRVQR